MQFLTLFVLIPVAVLGKSTLDSATEWSDEDFTLKSTKNQQGPTTAQTVKPPQDEISSTENPILPFLLNQYIEEKLNEIENSNNKESKRVEFSPQKYVKEPEVILTPPAPYPTSNKDKTNINLTTSSESSEDGSSDELSTTTDGSITETTTSDSFEVQDDDSAESTSGLANNSTTRQPIPIAPKVYAENYQNYGQISTTETSMQLADENKQKIDNQFIGASSENPIIESTPLTLETTTEINNMMDKVTFENPEEEDAVQQHPKYVVFLRPTGYHSSQLMKIPIESEDDSSLMTKIFPPRSSQQQESGAYADQDFSSDTFINNRHQEERPMTQAYSPPYMSSYYNTRPIMPNYYQYQFQRNNFPMRNAMMQQPQSYYFNPQMMIPQQMQIMPSFSGDYYRRNYWTQPFYTRPNYYNNYPYSSYNYGPKGFYGNGNNMAMTPNNYFAF